MSDRDFYILNFDGLLTIADGLQRAHADAPDHVYVLADLPADPHLANHADRGWIQFSDFIYPSAAFASPEDAHLDLGERASTALWGPLFVPADRVDPDADASAGRVFTPGEFSEHVTDLSTDHRDSIIITGEFRPPGDVSFLAPGEGAGMDPGAYTFGESSIPAPVLPGRDISHIMAMNTTLMGALIIPREVASEDALEIADRGVTVEVETEPDDEDEPEPLTDGGQNVDAARLFGEALHHGELICDDCGASVDLADADSPEDARVTWNEHVRSAHRDGADEPEVRTDGGQNAAADSNALLELETDGEPLTLFLFESGEPLTLIRQDGGTFHARLPDGGELLGVVHRE